jgi:hypothetical protein
VHHNGATSIPALPERSVVREFTCHAIGAFGAVAGCGNRQARPALLRRQGVRENPMDWRNAMVRTETPHATPEDDAAYAAGWTISGLATLGTIIAVWMFAI